MECEAYATDDNLVSGLGGSLKGKGKGKTNADMKSMGRGLAKIAAQKRG
jgi:hypothetical protein